MTTAKAERDPRLVPVVRPNGKIYRPRKIVAYPVADNDELTCGVCVLGTHDLAVAQPLADQCVYAWIDSGLVAIEPETGWFREGYEGYSGQLMWVRDPVKGRAGIMFRETAEVPGGVIEIIGPVEVVSDGASV